MRILTVGQNDAGQRLDKFLQKTYRRFPISMMYKYIRQKDIKRNGKRCTPADRLCEGDVLTLYVKDDFLTQAPPVYDFLSASRQLDILYEDEDLLVLNKPAGIAIHSAALTEETVTVAGSVVHYLGQDSFHCVNRLDRGTTGAMVVAKTGYMHARCMALLHSGDFYREYRGVCLGQPQPPAGEITLPIGRDPSSVLRRRIDPEGLPSRTVYETLSTGGALSLLRLLPATGRTHQLRVHLAAIGHPLAGDWLYGTEDRALIARPALHSYILHLRQPLSGVDITVTAPIPEDMTRLIQREAL